MARKNTPPEYGESDCVQNQLSDVILIMPLFAREP